MAASFEKGQAVEYRVGRGFGRGTYRGEESGKVIIETPSGKLLRRKPESVRAAQ